MIQIRKAGERGHFDHGWLDTSHTFSFADYDDPRYRHFRSLRVLNEDRIQPGRGFGMHPHRDMEILTYVLEGTLAHRDSLGHGSRIRAGELQRMTAGTGILHSEFNASETEPVHLYQVWLFPDRRGLAPGYEQRAFEPSEQIGQWRLVAAPAGDGQDGALTIHQDARVSLATLDPTAPLSYTLPPGRHAWLQVLRGRATLNGQPLDAGDGAAVSGEPALALQTDQPADVLLFDLA